MVDSICKVSWPCLWVLPPIGLVAVIVALVTLVIKRTRTLKHAEADEKEAAPH